MKKGSDHGNCWDRAGLLLYRTTSFQRLLGLWDHSTRCTGGSQTLFLVLTASSEPHHTACCVIGKLSQHLFRVPMKFARMSAITWQPKAMSFVPATMSSHPFKLISNGTQNGLLF